MKRTLAVVVAAVGLIGWADPKMAAPQVGKDEAAAEAKREAAYVYVSRLKEARRVEDIAWRLEVANQDLCADRAPRLGVDWASAEQFNAKSRQAAIEGLQLGDGLTVISVAAGSPAEAAGLAAGDVVVSLNGKPAPSGRDAADRMDKQAREVLGSSLTPVSFVVRRGGETRTLSLTPVMGCAYGVSVEDGADINAAADGKTIHVFRPLLRVAASDDELALVLAHELAHNGQHHLQAQAHNARVGMFGGLLLDAAAAAAGVNTGAWFAKEGLQIGAAHASPEFEAEADYVGLYYLARAGYPTAGAEDFWRKMAVEFPESIFVKTDHPTSPARFIAIAAASKEIEAKRAKGEPLVPNARSN